MIDAKVKIHNLPVLDRYNNKIGSANAKLKGLSVYASTMLRSKAMSNLKQLLGPKAANYTVEIIPAGFATVVEMRPLNEKGQLLFSGAKPHSYSSTRPMPIGDGRFAYKVSHPGFKGKEKEIKEAMRKAVTETRMEVQQIIRRGFL